MKFSSMIQIIRGVFIAGIFLLVTFSSCKCLMPKPLSETAATDFTSLATSPYTQNSQPAPAVTSHGLTTKVLQADGSSAEGMQEGDPRFLTTTTASRTPSSPSPLPNQASSVLGRLGMNADPVLPTSAENSPDLAEEVLAQLDNFTCGPRWSCVDVYANPELFEVWYYDKMNCACDDLCHYYNDCCADASPRPSVVEFFGPWLPYLSCGIVYGVNERISYIGRCPPDWTDESSRAKCQNPDIHAALQVAPAVGITSGLTYRNVFCGLCHREKVVFWSADIECTGYQPFKQNMTLDEALQNRECEIAFLVPPNCTNPRPCTYQIMSKSPCLSAYKGTILQEKCETTQGRLAYYKKDLFNNSYCAACTLAEPTGVFGSLGCFPRSRLTVSLPPGPYSLSILFDMNVLDGGGSVGVGVLKPPTGNKDTESCTADEVYDPFKKTCRKVICKPGLIFINGTCITNTSTSFNETDKEVFIDCPRIALNESEFTILPDDTLFVHSSGSNHSATEYFLDGSTAYVCTNFTQNATLAQGPEDKIVLTFSRAEAIVSTVCLVLSVASLLVVLVIYSCFGSLRNTPGLILMSLALALVTADSLMLVAPAAASSALGCRAVGTAMHFFFLAAFFWMNVMAVDVRATFSKSFHRVDECGRKSRRLLLYSLYAWGVPLLTIAAALAVEQWGPRSSNLRPGYGEGLCWITNKLALLVFFAGPACLLILVDVLLFVCAARNIYASQASGQQAGRQGTRRERLSVYARLTAVTGLAWTFGLLAAFIPLPPLWYVFIVANALQGAFIFASFALTPRVRALFRARFGSRRRLRGDMASSSGREGSTSTQLSVLRVHSDPEP